MRITAIFFVLGAAFPVLAQVSVTAPANNSQVATTVQFVATARTACAKGVSAIGIYTAPNVLAYRANGSSLNTLLNLAPGTYQTVVQAWDNCGGVSKASVSIVVKGTTPEVQVSAPSNNATVGTQVQYTATARTSCANGVAAMGIYTAPGILAHVAPGASLSKVLTLAPGSYQTVVQEWDNCGGSASTPIAIKVAGSSAGGNVQVSAPANNSNVASTVQYVTASMCRHTIPAVGNCACRPEMATTATPRAELLDIPSPR